MLPLMKRFQFSRRQECDTSTVRVQLDRVHVTRKSGVVSRKTNYQLLSRETSQVGHERYICVALSKVYTYLDVQRGDRGQAVSMLFSSFFTATSLVYTDTGHGSVSAKRNSAA